MKKMTEMIHEFTTSDDPRAYVDGLSDDEAAAFRDAISGYLGVALCIAKGLRDALEDLVPAVVAMSKAFAELIPEEGRDDE